MLNALTVDVEDWYHTLDFNFPAETWGNYEDRIEYSLKKLTDLFAEHDLKATFFVLGCVAQKHKALIRGLAQQGHEIGSHGCWHRLVTLQDEAAFRADVRESKALLSDITGKKVELFRASSWSISQSTLWALKILEEEGFVCDSSIQPFKTFLSGMAGAPVGPFHPVVNGERLNLLEIPPTVYRLGKITVPFCGGFYLRAVPLPMIKGFMRGVNKTRSGLVYIHPWEVDEKQPRLKVSPMVKLSHYYRLNQNLDKFEKLIQSFAFAPLGALLKNERYPSVSI
jgi:Predicted xylanase/chitin deacetylase